MMYLTLETIHEKCEGCTRVHTIEAGGESRTFCNVYKAPSVWWEKRGRCAMATHTGRKRVEEQKKVNPLKASRRSKKVRK